MKVHRDRQSAQTTARREPLLEKGIDLAGRLAGFAALNSLPPCL